jgi:hypothetical protein
MGRPPGDGRWRRRTNFMTSTHALAAESGSPVPFATSRNFLLISGIASSVLYVVVDVLASLLWEGYSYSSQAFSELTAIEAPTRRLMVYGNAIPYTLLVLAFAVGVWASAGHKRALRVAAGFLAAYAIAGFIGGVVFPMHSRGTQTTITTADAMHIVATSVGLIFMLLFIGFGAAAFGNRFRLYSIGTLLLLILGGAYSYWAAFSRMAAQLPTPGMGVMERINIYATMLWVAMLAIVLLRIPRVRPFYRGSARL